MIHPYTDQQGDPLSRGQLARSMAEAVLANVLVIQAVAGRGVEIAVAIEASGMTVAGDGAMFQTPSEVPLDEPTRRMAEVAANDLVAAWGAGTLDPRIVARILLQHNADHKIASLREALGEGV